MKHPSQDDLRRASDLAVDRDELGELAWHLYRCGACRRRLAALPGAGGPLLAQIWGDLDPPSDPRPDGGYAPAFDVARRRAVMRGAVAEVERHVAREAVAALAPLAPDARRERVLRDPSLHSWACAEELLDVCHGRVRDDPAESERWARLALDVAGEVRARRDPYRPGDELVSDLEGRILADLATSLRVQSRLREADRAIADAERKLGRGTGDGLERAALLESEASLRRAQRRFGEALALTERAARLYRRLGESSRWVRTLVNRATLESHLDRRPAAIRTLHRALESLDPATEPGLWMMASYNLAATLHEEGRAAEAAERLAAVRPHVESEGGAVDRARLAWFEGVVARDSGAPARAERLLRSGHDEFLRLEMAYEVALVSLDLAGLYLDQGRTAETRGLAESMLPIFRSREIHREATAALLLFHRAALAETATATLAAEVAAKVRRGRARGRRQADERPS